MDRDLNGAIDWAEWERFHRPLSVYFDDDEAYEDYVRSLWSLPPRVPRQHARLHGVPIDDNPESNIPAHMRPPFQPERVPRQSFTAQLRQGKTDVDVWNDGPAAVVGGAWMGGNESKAPPTQEGTLRARYPCDHLGRREAVVVVGTTIPTVMNPDTLAEPAPGGADEQWRTLRRSPRRIKGSAEWKQLTQGTSTSPLGPGHAQLERAASHASPEGLRLKGGAPRSSRPTTPLRGNTAKRDSVRAGAVRHSR